MAAAFKRNHSRRRLAALTFLSNISLDGQQQQQVEAIIVAPLAVNEDAIVCCNKVEDNNVVQKCSISTPIAQRHQSQRKSFLSGKKQKSVEQLYTPNGNNNYVNSPTSKQSNDSEQRFSNLNAGITFRERY